MATYYDDNEYEYEKKGGGFFGKFIAFLLGFLFCLICMVGGLAGLGYTLYAKMKIKSGFDAINNLTGAGIKYEDYVTEEYAQKTISDLVKDLSALSTDFQNQTASLSSLEKFSPKVREVAEKLADTIKEYGVFVDTDVLLKTPFQKMNVFLTDTINGVEVGKVLEKAGMLKKENDSYALLMLLCYGEENEDYIIKADGNVEMQNGATPTTVGDLTANTTQVFDKITLAAIMDTSGNLDKSDPMIRALLYGTEGVTYKYDEKTQKVDMLPLAYTHDETTNAITDADGKIYAYNAATQRWEAENGGFIIVGKQEEAPSPVAPASYAADGAKTYDYFVYAADKTLICRLQKTGDAKGNTYNAFDKNDKILKHEPLSVGDLMGGDIMGIFENIRLGDVLNVTPNSDPILLALAYGSEGTDYEIKDGKIHTLTDPTTIGSLTGGDTDALFDKIELGAVMNVAPEDDVMCALAYGAKDKTYRIEETAAGKTVKMLPILYALKEGALYDKDGKAVKAEATATAGIYKVTLVTGTGDKQKTEIYYAKADKTGDTAYYLYTDEACTGAKVLYKKTTLSDLTNGDASALLNDVELGALMGLKGTSDKMLLALAYGTEGVDYEIDVETQVIRPLTGGKSPTTVGDLRNDETAGNLLNGIELGAVLGISPLDEAPDPMMLALAYGEEGVDYEIAEENGKNVVRWLGDSKPRTIGDLTSGDSSIFDSVTLAGVMNLTPDSDPVMISLAYGRDTHYTITDGKFVMLPVRYTLKEGALYDEDGEAVKTETTATAGIYKVTLVTGAGDKQKTEIYYAKADKADEAAYYLYTDEACTGAKVLYKKTSIADLKGDNASDIIKDVQLASVLNVTPASDSIMIALAYGSEGKDFVYMLDEQGNKIGFEMIGGSKPRTIKDLQDGDLINQVELGAALGVSPLDNTADKLMVALAYGNEGQHYEIVGGEIVWNTDTEGNPYHPRTIADLKDGSGIINDIYLATVLEVTPASDSILIALAYGNEGENFVYTLDEKGNKTGFEMMGDAKPRTIKELQSGELINQVQLGAVLGVSPLSENPDEIMLSLAYGNEGQHYEIVGGKIVWKTDAQGNPYKPRTIADLKNGSGIIDDIYLSTVLSVNAASEEIMRSLAYGNEGEDYRIENGAIVMADGKHPRTIGELKGKNIVEDIRLSAILTPDTSDKITMYLLYGVEGIHYEIVDGKVNMLGDFKPRTVGDLSGENSPVSTITQDLTIGDLVGGGDSQLMKAVSDWKIADLGEKSKIDSLTLGQVIVIDPKNDPALLVSLADTSIGELNGKIETLKLAEILGEDSVKQSTFLKHLKDSTVNSLAGDLEKLTIQEVFEDKIYTTDESGNKVLTGTWKYLLTTKNAEGDSVEVRYTLNQMDQLVSNMTENIRGATMRDLYNDGIIALDNPQKFLDTKIIYTYTITVGTFSQQVFSIDESVCGGKQYIGDLTITQMLNYVNAVLGALSAP